MSHNARYGFRVRDGGLLGLGLLGHSRHCCRGSSRVVHGGGRLDESLARFPPLIDGNRRTAWTLMSLMLWIYGHPHDFAADEAFDLLLGGGRGTTGIPGGRVSEFPAHGPTVGLLTRAKKEGRHNVHT